MGDGWISQCNTQIKSSIIRIEQFYSILKNSKSTRKQILIIFNVINRHIFKNQYCCLRNLLPLCKYKPPNEIKFLNNQYFMKNINTCLFKCRTTPETESSIRSWTSFTEIGIRESLGVDTLALVPDSIILNKGKV